MHLVRLCYISKRTGCDSNGWDDWIYHTLNWSDQVLYGAMIYWKCFSMDGCRGTRRSKMSCQWSNRATKSWEMSPSTKLPGTELVKHSDLAMIDRSWSLAIPGEP